MLYVPRDFIDELEGVKVDKGFNRNVDAFDEIKGYCKVGRELERLMNFGLVKKRRRRS